jgi:hypothetical protein
MKGGGTQMKERWRETERKYEMNRLHGAEASFRMLIVAQLLKKFSDFFGT